MRNIQRTVCLCLLALTVSCGPRVSKDLQKAIDLNPANVDYVFQVVMAGADVNGLDSYSKEPLIFRLCNSILFNLPGTESHKMLEILGIFLRNGLDVNTYTRGSGSYAVDCEPITPLHYLLYQSGHAAESGWNISAINQAVSMLIKNGADVNKLNSCGQTPLDYYFAGFPSHNVVTRTVQSNGGR